MSIPAAFKTGGEKKRRGCCHAFVPKGASRCAIYVKCPMDAPYVV